MLKHLQAVVLGLGLFCASPLVGQASVLQRAHIARDHTWSASASGVTLRVSAGYNNVYRDSAWTPIHVTLHNSTASDIAGTVQVPEHSQSPSLGASQSFHGLYSVSITVPAGSTKYVTIYIPGPRVQGQVSAVFMAGDRTAAIGTAYPMGIDSGALMVGVLGGAPADFAWVTGAAQREATSHVIALDATTLDAVPQALATFDVIALTNFDASRLDAPQLGALSQYVRSGGSLLLIGGPNWQGTLRPLPAALVPGRIVGSRTVSNLRGLVPLGAPATPRGKQSTEISVLRTPRGSVAAEEDGIPLVVRELVGNGVIEYLAFDPVLHPVQGWQSATSVLGHLVAMSAPLAVGRSTAPQGIRSRFVRTFSSLGVTDELSNLPASRLHLLTFFAVLTVVYVLLIGPLAFFVLRRFRRQYLGLVAIPVLACIYVGSISALSTRLQASSVELNSIGFVTLGGTGSVHPATFYTGMIAPLAGSYDVTYESAALPSAFPRLSNFSFRNPISPGPTPLGVQMQEGQHTTFSFPAMTEWSMRDVSLTTSVPVQGGLQSRLRLNDHGDIVGTIHNGTRLTLLDPVLVAGQQVAHLQPIPPGGTIRASVRPNNDNSSFGSSSVWSRLYGDSNSNDSSDPGFFGPGSFFDGPSLPHENTLNDRVRNTSSVLSQTQQLSALGSVALVAWTDAPLTPMTVNGSTPQRRDLTLIAAPLTVDFPSAGSFQLRPGTLAVHLIDILAQPPKTTCCNWFSRSGHLIDIGPGGYATLDISIPHSSRVRFHQLSLVPASMSDGVASSAVFDWRDHRWVHVDLNSESVDLKNPNRFVSKDGQVVVQVRSTADSGDVTIDDVNAAIQLSGSGTVS